MTSIKYIKYYNDTPKELKKFGLLMAVFLPAIFGTIYPWLRGTTINLTPFYLAPVFAIFAIAAPKLLRYPYRIWMTIGVYLGKINSVIVLSIIFFLILTPLAIMRKLFTHKHKNDVGWEIDKEMKTYRIENTNQYDETTLKTRMERIF